MTVDDPEHGYSRTLTERERYSLEADMLKQLELERRCGRREGGTTIDTEPRRKGSTREVGVISNG